jgi:hypothetical protein
MTEICEMVTAAVRDHPQTLKQLGMEARLWGHVFGTTNPHIFIDPWSFYRSLPDIIGDFVAMWGDPRVDVKAEETLPTPNPLPEDIFGLILQGRDGTPELFKDPTMEPKLFAYCLNATRPHSEAHGRTMCNTTPQVIQEFVEKWGPTFEMAAEAERSLPPGLIGPLEKSDGEPPGKYVVEDADGERLVNKPVEQPKQPYTGKKRR